MNQMTGPSFSLLQYEGEIDVTDSWQAYQLSKNQQKIEDHKLSLEDLVNTMLPPRDWKSENNRSYMQYVSHRKPERVNVQSLKKSLEDQLVLQQARTEGICPIRQYLFSQAFDQIIRQVTLNCPERGLLLMRVRDQHKMTISAYQALYESSKAFGMRKQIQSEEGIGDIEEQINVLETKKASLQAKIENLQSTQGSLSKKIRERRAIQTQRNDLELNAIREQFKYLQKFVSSARKPTKPEPIEQKQEQVIQ